MRFVLLGIVCAALASMAAATGSGDNCSALIAASFSLAVPGGINPFDYQAFLVQVRLNLPNGSVFAVPAFYDGALQQQGGFPQTRPPNATAPFTWRLRYTARIAGSYSVAGVTLNSVAQPSVVVVPASWSIACPANNFVHVDADGKHFRFDNGTQYYPVGHDHAYATNGSGTNTAEAIVNEMRIMAENGLNWVRIVEDPYEYPATLTLWWNYDCTGGSGTWPGYINLPTAQRWDQIMDGAAQYGVYVHWVLFDSSVWGTTIYGAGNWGNNPWNIYNYQSTGCFPFGFLATPDELFTNPTAYYYVRNIVYYTVARWGYSPFVAAFEAMNEIDFAQYFIDVADPGAPAQWTSACVANVIRTYDLNKHLVTGSPGWVEPDNTMFQQLDFYQQHLYLPDGTDNFAQYFALVPPESNALVPPVSGKPLMVTEFGVYNPTTPKQTAGVTHQGVWASAMRWEAPAASWYGTAVPPIVPSLDAIYGAFATFARVSGMWRTTQLVNVNAATSTVTTRCGLELTTPFASQFGTSNANVQNPYPYFFNLTASGTTPRYAFSNPQISGYLGDASVFFNQVQTNPTFQLSSPVVTVVNITVEQSAPAAVLQVILDGMIVEVIDDPIPGLPYIVLVPAGAHRMSISNPGNGSFTLGTITLEDDYAYALFSLSRVSPTLFVSWIYTNPTCPYYDEAPINDGQIQVPTDVLRSGVYAVGWFDTNAGTVTYGPSVQVHHGQPLMLAVPPVVGDVALFVSYASPLPSTLSAGAIVGIVIGSIIAALLFFGLVVLLGRFTDGAGTASTAYQPMSAQLAPGPPASGDGDEHKLHL